MKRFFLYIAFVNFIFQINAQTITQVTHYSVDNGLSENHVLCMLQDRKGIMWFGTYDGLNKFDGYTFKNFKGDGNQKYQLVNFRIDKLYEDNLGYLWIETNDGRIYRFDTSTETFLAVPQCFDEYKYYKTPLNRIYILPDGTIWLKNNEPENEDCFKVENTSTSQKIKLTHITKNNGKLSSNKIIKIYQDRSLNTWILTSRGIDLLKKGTSKSTPLIKEQSECEYSSIFENNDEIFIGGENGKLWIFDKLNGTLDFIKTPFQNNIIDIKQINTSEILLLTNTSNFYIYHINSNFFEVFKLTNLKNNRVYGCYKDRNNNIWIDTDNQGAILFDSNTKSINYLQVKAGKYDNFITTKFYVVEDIFNNIWVQTRVGGFYKYNNEINSLESIPSQDPNEQSLSGIIHTAVSDNQGNLWISTYLQGVDKIVFRQSPFIFTKPTDAPSFSSFNEIRSIYKDNKNRLWLGTKKGSLFIYDENRKLLGPLGFDGILNSKNSFNIAVYDIKEDHTGTIWLATKGMGLFKLVPASNHTFTVIHYQNDPKNVYSISSNSVYSIFEDHLHRIWIGTFRGGLNLLDTSTGEVRFINSKNQLKNYPLKECLKVRYITENNSGNIFVGTTQGLIVFNADKSIPEKIIFNRFVHDPKDKFSLSGNDILYILNSQKGDVYLALNGGGINIIKGGYQPDKKTKFEILQNTSGISLNVVYTLVEDNKGRVWMSNQTQIVSYNPETKKFETYKPISRNNYFFGEAAACMTKQGEIIYGTSDGIVSFNPLKINKSVYVPSIYFPQLQIFNKTVNIAEDDSPLKTTIDETKELILNHKQNIISIEYAALDYVNPNTIQYAYKLEGVESDWNYVGNQRIANYINLPKGRYIFRVKSTNSEGEWVKNEKSIVIIKLPSFWESNWGLVFYIIMFVVFSASIAYILFIFYRLRNEINIEHRITNLKLRFFTDISHELRTPLTLITSPIDNILKKETLSASANEQLHIVQRNTGRMLRLINQILDFRKIQNKKMKLIIELVHVADFLGEISENFKKLAEDKNITLTITDNTKNTQLWIDKDKFEKIFFNLLSNAFKFTNTNKTIDINVSEEPDKVIITVRDQGCGISKDKLKFLFERFESFTSSRGSLQASTGIGLSLTKELVELHKAEIEVESDFGKGSTFKVAFRKGFKHFGDKEEFVLRDLESIETDFEKTDPEIQHENIVLNALEPNERTTDERPKILIVEDNRELRIFLTSALNKNYDVIDTENGRTALDIALSDCPDIIISDVMMPDMDGLELARNLKEDMNTSHIPFILLTAKTDMESKLEAMELGADDYITKPFNLSYLEARIDNILKIRNQLQNYFQSSLTSGVITLSKPTVTNLDDIFIKKTIKYIEENYENSGMNIDDIAENTGVSRSSFFKKIKSLTGLAPVDFIREFRIQKATQLIEGGETNVSQIAFNVGINDTRYFSKCFRQKYGMNPSEYITKKTTKPHSQI